MNRPLYMTVIAFAAVAAVHSHARAEEPGRAELMELINEDLDAAQDDFTLSLVHRTGRRIARKMDARDDVFGPLVASSDKIAETFAADTGADLTAIVVARADFEIGKDAANIENPFNPRLPMAPAIVAFVSEEQ